MMNYLGQNNGPGWGGVGGPGIYKPKKPPIGPPNLLAPFPPATPTTAAPTAQGSGSALQYPPTTSTPAVSTPASSTPATAGGTTTATASSTPATAGNLPPVGPGNAPDLAPPSWWDKSMMGSYQNWFSAHQNDPNWQASLQKMRTPGGTNLNANDPNSPFYGINMTQLQQEDPALYASIMRVTGANPGKLGDTYKMLIGQLGRAVSGPDPFQKNDIRNSAQVLQNQGAAQNYDQQRGLAMQAALSGSSDTGEAKQYEAKQEAALNQATNQKEAASIANLLGYNAQYRYNNLQNAISNLNAWAQNRRARRMSDAGVGAQAAYAGNMANAEQQAAQWQLGSGLLGAGSSVAGNYLGGGG